MGKHLAYTYVCVHEGKVHTNQNAQACIDINMPLHTHKCT